MTEGLPFENMNMDAFLAFIENNKPHWADDIIQPWDESDSSLKEQFISSHYWCDNASINVFQVVGTAHYQYQGKSWLQCLNEGKRMDTNIPLLISNPTYYSSVKAKRPLMDFKTWDGLNYFINHDGLHRAVLCRFYFHFTGETQIHGVTVDHYKLNDAFYTLFKAVTAFIKQHNLPIIVNPVRACSGRDDTAGWKIDHFKTEVLWRDMNEIECALPLTEAELRLKFEALKHTINQQVRIKQQKRISHSWFKRFKKMYNIK